MFTDVLFGENFQIKFMSPKFSIKPKCAATNNTNKIIYNPNYEMVKNITLLDDKDFPGLR